jgi:hypothetical protein
MSIFDKTKVAAFTDKFDGDPVAVFCFFAALDDCTLIPVRVLHLVRDFRALAIWEQVNVLYELRDRADEGMAHLTNLYKVNARQAEDEGWG